MNVAKERWLAYQKKLTTYDFTMLDTTMLDDNSIDEIILK